MRSAWYIKPSKLLREMRWVHNHDAVEGEKPGIRNQRELKLANPGKWYAMYQAEEGAYRKALHESRERWKAGLGSGKGVSFSDVGQERVGELVDKLLGEL